MSRDHVLTLRITVGDETAVRAAALASTAKLFNDVPEGSDLAMSRSQAVPIALVAHLTSVLGDVLVEGRLPGIVGIRVSVSKPPSPE